MMRQTRKLIGDIGIGLVLAGLVVALTGAALSRSQPGAGLLLIFAASILYIPGGIMTVSHYGFVRGTKSYLFITFTRMIYALAAVATFVLGMGGA